MAAETGPPPAEDLSSKSEEHSSSVPTKAVVIAAAFLAVMIALIVYGYLDLPGSGWIGVANKRFWDYLELLIVPAALAIGVYLLNRAQSERERAAEDAQQERERQAQAAQRQRELEVENQRAQDSVLEAYLDQMSQLLLDKDRPLGHPRKGDEVRTLARARTLTVLRRLDGERKGRVVQFLHEAGLIAKDRPVLVLIGADLSGVRLNYTYLDKTYLSGANLSGTSLRGLT